MEVTRICANCQQEFPPKAEWQKCCTTACNNRLRQKRYRAKHRKGGGGGGGGNGGGGGPTLFDTITPQDDRAFTPIPVIGPKEAEQRKPAVTVTGSIPKSRKAAA